MYIPAHFAARDQALLQGFIAANAFGLLLSGGGADLIGSHIPFLLEREDGGPGRLVCHLAAANPQAAALDGADVLCVFQGPHGYISPRWYAKKPAVPTWNYMAVHAYGRATVIRDATRLRGIVDRLSKVYEPEEGGWRLDDEPDNFVDAMLRGIVGVEIAISRLEGKFKLSQNRPADIALVAAALRKEGGEDNLRLADAMERATPKR
ncbi:FMN-binding negative transcriptional regulator [uncultured Ferrovibrio sp.]|uniref:FMN-binding negative transcriptional regulator n=1 Tax=uncultured Ferrovibrio sp. TaxID=1576913 RepID=UPI00260F26D6|nr:FMN-binding negative transcriptional regulator [uncultured Ferrovibrio sp.]